jgi:hypothetical protein
MIPSANLQGFSRTGGSNFACTVNAQGGLALIGRPGDADFPAPFGVRYDPAGTTDATLGYKGTGSWSNITVDPSYGWSRGSRRTL